MRWRDAPEPQISLKVLMNFCFAAGGLKILLDSRFEATWDDGIIKVRTKDLEERTKYRWGRGDRFR